MKSLKAQKRDERLKKQRMEKLTQLVDCVCIAENEDLCPDFDGLIEFLAEEMRQVEN